MSLFLLSDNREKAEAIDRTWTRLFGRSEVLCLSGGLFITITDAFRSKPSFRRVSEESSVFGFGTFFSEKGFGEDAISGIGDLSRIEETYEILSGHYLFVLNSGGVTTLFTDPVGLINVYWSHRGGVLVSNSLAAMAELECNLSFDRCGVQEFVMREATVGADTIFSDFKRLRFSHGLTVGNRTVSEFKLGEFVPQKIDFDTYLARVRTYFNGVSRYPGTVMAELSAGYDTRLVASCAASCIPKMRLVTNANTSDHGADVAIAKRLAKIFRLPIDVIPRPQGVLSSSEALLHASSAGRDVIRAKASLDIAKPKFRLGDLVLGGYGGEVVRGKYCKYSDLSDIARGYYGGYVALKKFDIESEFVSHVTEKLREDYAREWISTSQQLCQWIYALDRMRIWGGARVTMMALYGDNLHPFMDWKLLWPLFAWDYSEIHGASLQHRLIRSFSEDAMSLPINPKRPFSGLYDRANQRLRMVWARVENMMLLGKRADSGREHYSDQFFSCDLQKVSGLLLNEMLKCGSKNHLTCFATVQMVSELSQRK